MSTRIPFKWNTANFAWNLNPFPDQSKNPFTWNDVALITEVVTSLGGGMPPETIFKDKKKKKKFITLIMKCNMLDKDYKETKEIKDYKISIDDISLVAKEVLGINVKIDI